ncbi:hypothetical protein Hsw_0899 [Hymenobacter swuensis DY53]|uniref:Uncharacterized protein n=1 Tax=Hymenobacter swuensis DY53 TaxID=1227739 RepID=W8ETM7_9BACT|nr:hypothetical protein Hsw_0899 [Hymenobacter swuensis DY53]
MEASALCAEAFFWFFPKLIIARFFLLNTLFTASKNHRFKLKSVILQPKNQ